MVASMTIFGSFSALLGTGLKIYHFHFSAVAEAVCTPTMASCVFFTSQYPITKIKCSPVV